MTQIVAYVSQLQSALLLKFPWIWTSVANKKLLFKRNCMYVQIDSLLFLEESRTILDITNVPNKKHGSERALKLYLFWFFRYQCIIYDVDVGLNTQAEWLSIWMKGQEVIGAAAHTSLQNRNWPQAQRTAELFSERYI